jgi:hypothetical protein
MIKTPMGMPMVIKLVSLIGCPRNPGTKAINMMNEKYITKMIDDNPQANRERWVISC